MANLRRAPRRLGAYDPIPSASAPVETAPIAPALEPPVDAKIKSTGAEAVPLTTLISAKDRKRLRQLALDKECSLQTLGIAAWSLLLEAEGMSGLKPQKANRPSGRRRAVASR